VRDAATRVTIIIVNYQSYEELTTCVTALAGEAAAGHEIVVVDQNSRQPAADLLARQFPHLSLLREPSNDGFAAGVNRGAHGRESAYLFLVNPDSVVEAGLVDRLRDWMDAHPDVGAVGPRILNDDGSVQASARRFPDFTTGLAGRSSWLTKAFPRNPLSRRNLPGVEVTSGRPLDVDWVSGACVMLRRQAFDLVGGMDEEFFLYWEDADLCRRLKNAGWRTVYLPEVTATHLGGRSSRHAADASLVAFHRSAYRLFSKHASRRTRPLAPFVWLALRVRLAVMRIRIGRETKRP
jgi:GT2 family glycosyltransferase